MPQSHSADQHYGAMRKRHRAHTVTTQLKSPALTSSETVFIARLEPHRKTIQGLIQNLLTPWEQQQTTI